MGSPLIKTRTVLRRDANWPSYKPVTEEGESPRLTRVTLDPDVFDDMGQPDTITVTIEPGDRLNDE